MHRLHRHPLSLPVPLALAALALAGGCASREEPPQHPPVAPPMEGVQYAYASASQVQLPARAPEDYPELHNVFHLGEGIISGGEPHSEEALALLASWGVKTILSVDGKAPDAEAAARHGLRYVHVPIQYKTIAEDELVKIAKTFRELEGPFYVHCFHGKHRGPAAAAVGRLVRDGVPREQVIAEMRQWCGTSNKYEGLYRALALSGIPGVETTEGYEWDFPSAAPVEGLRGAMVGISRAYDNLELLVERGWAVDPAHPDVDPLNEAQQLRDLFAASVALDAGVDRPENFRQWLDDSLQASRELVEALGAHAGGEAAAAARADAALEWVAENCSACHKVYRNN